MFPSLTLVDRVDRGELNFKRFVEVLSDRGYITDHDDEALCSFGSTAIEKASQEDFDSLFEHFFPGQLNDIQISCAATDKGGPSGSFCYGLYNSNVISLETMLQILIRLNRQTAKYLEQDEE